MERTMNRLALGTVFLMTLSGIPGSGGSAADPESMDDPVIPSPAMVRASDGTFNNLIEISWDAVDGAGRYQVFRCLDRGNSCGPPIASPKRTTFDDTTATPGQLYYYRVRACTLAVCSKFSIANQGHMAAGLVAPVITRASDGAFDDHVEISWKAVGGAIDYQVFRCLDRGNTCGPPIASPKATRFDDPTGKPKQVYYYRVRACTTTGCSKFSIADPGYRGNEVKLTASDAADGDVFGRAVAISGDRAIVGAYGNDDYGNNTGSAYVFELDPSGVWIQQRKLLASDAAAGDKFGRSVAISGDRAIVGAPGKHDDANGSDSGSAYIFERDPAGNWIQQQKLLASDGTAYDYFGYSVAMSGDRAIVGAPENSIGDYENGTAYIFERDPTGNWTQQQKLSASDGHGGDEFGHSVAISGNRAIVGAYRDNYFSDTYWLGTGSAYVFERDSTGNWTQQQQLLASDAAEQFRFGWSVDISGDRAIIGAFSNSDGSAYVFERDASGVWGQQQKLWSSDRVDYDAFGFSVSISGERVIVGAHDNDDSGNSSGSAYIFERASTGNWTQQKLLAADGAAYDGFGRAVGIAGDRAIVGARGDDSGGLQSGSAYTFRLPLVPGRPTGVDASDGAHENRVVISWDAMEFAAVYQVFRCLDRGNSCGPPIASPKTTRFEDTGGNPEQVYYYRVRACMVTTCSKFSVADSGYRRRPSGVPQDVDASDGSHADRVVITWSVVESATRYQVFRCLDRGNSCGPPIASPKRTDFEDTGAGHGQIYYYRVRACSMSMCSKFSIADSGFRRVEYKLTASDAAFSDRFGGSVALSGDRAIIGAPHKDDNAQDSGSAYIFGLDPAGKWTQQHKLLASDPATRKYFGHAVAILGDRAIVGAYGNGVYGSYKGSAYIFERDPTGDWTQQQKLVASDAARDDRFGISVAISVDRIIVGASGNEHDGVPTGAAYVFERGATGNWTEQKLLASDGAADDYFGRSAISGDRAIVGAFGNDDNGERSGSAYIFERDAAGNWTEHQKLLAPDAADYDDFGVSVAISGDRVIVGERGSDDNASNSGAVYVFERDPSGNWIPKQKLFASVAVAEDNFGLSVAISGDRIIVGANGIDDGLDDPGAIYVFAQNFAGSWIQQYKLVASDRASLDRFGRSVMISGQRVIVGAYGNDDGGEESGSAYIFELP